MQVAPLKYGVVFKKAFSQKEVFEAFVQDVLGVTIDVDQIYQEYEYPEPAGKVKIKYDLFAEDERKRIIIEVQHIKEADFFDRFFYYHLASLLEQVKSYSAYHFNKTVYTVVVLTRAPKDRSVDFSVGHFAFEGRNERGEDLPFYPHRLVFLVPGQVCDETPSGVKEWLEVIEDSLDGEIDDSKYEKKRFGLLFESIRQQRISPEELARIKDEAAWELSQQEAHEDGRQEGREEGRQEGEVAASRRMLQRHLLKRYPALVEEREQVEQLADVEALEALLDALLESDTPQPFLQKLKALLTPSKTA